MLYQRVGEHSDKMTVFLKECCNPLKNTADLLRFMCLANQYAACGEIVSDGLVLAFSMEERSGDERDIIEFRPADRSRRFA